MARLKVTGQERGGRGNFKESNISTYYREAWVLAGCCRESKEVFMDICPPGPEGYGKR